MPFFEYITRDPKHEVSQLYRCETRRSKLRNVELHNSRRCHVVEFQKARNIALQRFPGMFWNFTLDNRKDLTHNSKYGR